MTKTKTPLPPQPYLTDEVVLTESLDCLMTHIPIKMEGVCDQKMLFEVLLRAASRGDSVEHASSRMSNVPCGNGIRYHLEKFNDMKTLEQEANQALQHCLPQKVINHRHYLAIDLNLLPYYGNASEVEAPYIYRSKAEQGTTRFFAYASIYLISRHHRFTLAIHPLRKGETLVAVITQLLSHLTPLQIKFRGLFLDRGFYCVSVIRWLKALRIPFIMPAIIRGKQGGTRSLCQGQQSHFTSYTLNSSEYGSVDCLMAVVRCYEKGHKGRHGVRFLLYVVFGFHASIQAIRSLYRQRFGIETSYRLKNCCRIRTTSKNPVVRFLFVALAFILVNLWIRLLLTWVSSSHRGGRFVHRHLFPLKTMLDFLAQSIDHHFPPHRSILLNSAI